MKSAAAWKTANLGGRRSGFTLIELLVVVAIIGILVSIVLSVTHTVLVRGRTAACISNLRQLSAGIGMYVGEHEGELPFGPKATAFGMNGNLYTSTGAPTSLITLIDGQNVGLGLAYPYLKDPKVFFCPGCDQPVDTNAELANFGKKQVQSSYYYRHGGNTNITDLGGAGVVIPRLADLGLNRQGKPIRAIVMDSQFLCAPGLKNFGVVQRTHHQQHFTNVLYSDGHVTTFPNRQGLLNVDITDGSATYQSFNLILQTFEKVDSGELEKIPGS